MLSWVTEIIIFHCLDDNGAPVQKKKNKLLKERLAEKDEQFKKEFEEKKKLQVIRFFRSCMRK